MFSDQHLPLRTASRKNSIWRELPENRLRRDMVTLEQASNAVPEDARVHSLQSWETQTTPQEQSNRTLTLVVEQRLADDLAFVAAAEEGVRAVSAAAIEERLDSTGLMIILTANETVAPNVLDAFRVMTQILGNCATRSR